MPLAFAAPPLFDGLWSEVASLDAIPIRRPDASAAMVKHVRSRGVTQVQRVRYQTPRFFAVGSIVVDVEFTGAGGRPMVASFIVYALPRDNILQLVALDGSKASITSLKLGIKSDTADTALSYLLFSKRALAIDSSGRTEHVMFSARHELLRPGLDAVAQGAIVAAIDNATAAHGRPGAWTISISQLVDGAIARAEYTTTKHGGGIYPPQLTARTGSVPLAQPVYRNGFRHFIDPATNEPLTAAQLQRWSAASYAAWEIHEKVRKDQLRAIAESSTAPNPPNADDYEREARATLRGIPGRYQELDVRAEEIKKLRAETERNGSQMAIRHHNRIVDAFNMDSVRAVSDHLDALCVVGQFQSYGQDRTLRAVNADTVRKFCRCLGGTLESVIKPHEIRPYMDDPVSFISAALNNPPRPNPDIRLLRAASTCQQ